MTSTEKQVLTHKWQEQGLGVAPFRAVCMISIPSNEVAEKNPTGYNNAMRSANEQARGFGVRLCTCYTCGMALMNNVVIRDAKGDHFVVGLDCAAKTYDSKLIAETKLMEKRRQKAIRQEKQKLAREQREREYEAEMQAQRNRNGGLTDRELEIQQRKDARRAEAEQHRADNMWLLEVLSAKAGGGGFVDSMMAELEQRSLGSLSPRQTDILRDIFGKAHGRRNSKKYDAACDVFDSHLPEED